MPDYLIKIVPAGSGEGAAFQPDVQGLRPGDPLPAQQDDCVSWNNTTNDTHQPWPADSNFVPLPELEPNDPNYLSDPIPPGHSSPTNYGVAPPSGSPSAITWTVYYCCKLHPTVTSERGIIAANIPPLN
jgi:hypothetical protein